MGAKWKRGTGPLKHPRIVRGSYKGRINTNGKMFAAISVANGGNGIAAIKEMGYCPNGNDNTLQRMASDFRRNPIVFAEIERLEAQMQRKALAVVDKIRHRAEEIMESEAKDRVPAMRLFAEMTPGALVPKEVKVDAKMTYADMVLAAQRKREGETVVTGEVAHDPVLPDAGPSEPESVE